MTRLKKNGDRILAFFQKKIIDEKLDNFVGYLSVIVIAIIFGILLSNYQIIGISLFGFVIGLAAVLLCLLNTEAGLYFTITYSFFSFHLNRFLFNDSLPVGVASDILVVATFLSLFMSKRFKYEFPKSTVIVCLMILYTYIGLQLFNPYAHSFQGWFLTLRKVLAEFMLLLIGYNLFRVRIFVKKFVVVVFILCTISGLYGCIQQIHGLFDFEIAWVTSDPHRFGLIYISGDFRKFSTMSDPSAFGVIMAAASVFYTIIALNQEKLKIRIILFVGVIIMILGMSFSGTRTANAMVIGGLVFYILLTINRNSTKIFAVVGSLIFVVLMYGPYSNQTINRFRTTFLGNKDESFKVRIQNKVFIRPYILSHPIGGGMRTSGAGGLQYNPGHRLAGFPPDSGYMKFALEAGWIGLAVLCILYFIILRNGIKAYFASNRKELKMLFAASTAFFFSLYVAQYAQDAIGQITDIVVYYPLIALTLRAKTFNENWDNVNLG